MSEGTISIGFTGTRRGMSKSQSLRVFSIINGGKDSISEAHHGCCIGGDAEFHEMCQILGVGIHGHPPIDKKFMAELTGYKNLAESNDYLTRDRHVVKSSSLLISAPYTMAPIPHSGTWYTTNYAEKKKKHIIIVYPNGSLETKSFVEPKTEELPIFNQIWESAVSDA